MTLARHPPTPIITGPLPPDIADRFELVPCTVDPAQVRLLVWSGGKIDFTVRQRNAAAAQTFLDHYCNDSTFRKEAHRAATLNMEMY